MANAVIGNSHICLFCCGANDNLDNCDHKSSPVHLFLELLQRFTNCYDLNGLSINCRNNEEQSNLSKLFCCKQCLPMVNNFCTDYHNMKCLELKLDFGLKCLVDKMKLVEEVPSKFVKLEMSEENVETTEILNSSAVDENHSSGNSLSYINSFRKKVIKLCSQHLSTSQPRLHLKRVIHRKKGMKFNCSKCDEVFHSEYKLKCHLIKQHKTWRCFKCQQDCSKKHKLLQHNHKYHPGSIRAPGKAYKTDQGMGAPLICRLCHRPFAHRLSLRRHLHMKHKDRRDKFRELINESALIVKGSTGKNEEGQIFTSEVSEEKASEEIDSTSTSNMTEVDLKGEKMTDSSGTATTSVANFVVIKEDIEHVEMNESNQQIFDCLENDTGSELEIFQCTKCLKYFPTNLKFQTPPSQTPHENSLCSECGEQFEPRSQTETPTISLEDSDKYNCKMCSQKFATKRALDYHLAYYHISPTSCPICAKTFPSRRKMLSHKRLVHSTKKFPCAKCGKNFKTTKLLKMHAMRHLGEEGKNAQCIECGKAFYTSAEMKDHRRRVHTNGEQKQETCQICKKTYKNSLSLNDHMKSHRKVRTVPQVMAAMAVPCPICQKTYPSKSSLRSHMRVVHSENKFHCSECGKGFRTRQNLTLHMITHQGEAARNIECTACGKKFLRRCTLWRHLRQAEKKGPEGTVICQICGKTLQPCDTLGWHLELCHHPVEGNKNMLDDRTQKATINFLTDNM